MAQRRTIIISLVLIILIAVPFVDTVIWFLISVMGLSLDNKTIYMVIAPIVTVLTVIAIITPVASIWMRLFRKMDESATRAQKAQAEAERLLAQRTDFVAYVSHEIRNPLNGIIGLADAMDDTKLNRRGREKIELIRKSSHDLLFLLNDILDISKIDEGKTALNPREASLHNLIQEIFQFWKPRAKEAGLKIRLNISESFPDFVEIDVHRFRQVVNNLVSNAIKYSECGSVVISADMDEEAGLAKISVLDTGVGVPPLLQSKIFSPYEQAHEEAKDAPRKLGTGLGLPIARRLARLMGGDVEIEDSSQAGSVFCFRFAAAPVQRNIDGEVSVERMRTLLSGQSALVADDSTASLIVAREHLMRLGLVVEIANSGAAALNLLNDHKYDLVFLDDNLGDMQGGDVMRSTRQDAKFIAYTGRATEADRRDFMEAGFDGFVSKPVRLDDLKFEIARIMHDE